MKTKLLNIGRRLFQLPFLEKALRKKTIDKPTHHFFSKLAPNNYQYPKGSWRSFDYKGIQLELDIHDYVSHYLYFGFEDRAHAQLMNLVKKGDTVLDIGTNYGTTILQLAQQVGAEGRCYGFEPDPTNYRICQQLLSLNNFRTIQVENIGLGNQKGTFTLVVDTPSNRSGNRIGKQVEGKETTTVQVEVLDEWVKKTQLASVQLIKIDVEGFEMKVLEGAENVLESMHPTLFIELDDTNLQEQGNSAKELVAFLEHKNYAIVHAETKESISSQQDFRHCHFDIIAQLKA